MKQGSNPRDDFKPLTIQASFGTPAPYLMYAVDDIIVKDKVNLDEMVAALQKTNAYGFYLRLGKSVTYCYMRNQYTGVPSTLELVEKDIYRWRFDRAYAQETPGDWTYPNTTDMTLYAKKDIEPIMQKITFNSPNTFEGLWASYAYQVKHRYALCYETTKMINIPVNLVQNDYATNRTMNAYSTQQLLDIFNQGKKIDIAPFYRIQNNSPHMEYPLTFVNQDEAFKRSLIEQE
jgi:hypothetical protein